MVSVNDVIWFDSDILLFWMDYIGVKFGYMGIISKCMIGIDCIVVGCIEFFVGFVSDSDVIEMFICN